MRNILNHIILFFSLGFLLVPWYSFGSVLGFEIRPFIVSLLFLPFVIRYKDLFRDVTSAKGVLLATVYLLFAGFLSLIWGSNLSQGVSIIIKNIIYLLFFLLFWAFVRNLIENGRKSLIVRYLYISIILFIAYNLLGSLIFGRPLFLGGVRYLFSGKVEMIQSYYFVPLMNFNPLNSNIIDRGSDLFQIPSFRNSLATSIVIVFALIFALSKKEAWRTLSLLFLSLCLLLSQSRSALIIFAIAWLVWLIYRKRFFIAIGLSSLFAILIVLFSVNVNISAFDRFEQIGEGVRSEMYPMTLDKISKSPLLGYGLGKDIEIGGKSFVVHNNILGGWYTSGILGLFASVLLLIALLLFVYRNRFCFKSKILFFVGVIPFMIIMRLLVGANDGFLSLQSWVGFAFCCVLFDKKLLRSYNIQEQ